MKKMLMMTAVFSLLAQTAVASPARIPGSGKNAERKLGLAEENVKEINEYDFQEEGVLRQNGGRGYIQMGIDTVTFSNPNKNMNQAYPYTKFELFPWDNSNIYIDGKVAYRFDYNKQHGASVRKVEGGGNGTGGGSGTGGTGGGSGNNGGGSGGGSGNNGGGSGGSGSNNNAANFQNVWGQSNATYTDFNVGQIYKVGDFFINYKVGYSNFNFQNTKLAYRREFRFVPKASYTFNDSLSWYLKGYLGNVKVEEKSNKVGEASIKHEKYIHKLESGLTYTVCKDLAVTVGALNRTKEEYAGEYAEWMYIGKLDYNLYSTDNLQIRPYFWYLYTPEVQTGLARSRTGLNPFEFEDEAGYKLGTYIDYQFAKNWALETEFAWYAPKKNDGSNTGNQGGNAAPKRKYMNSFMGRVGVKYYF